MAESSKEEVRLDSSVYLKVVEAKEVKSAGNNIDYKMIKND